MLFKITFLVSMEELPLMENVYQAIDTLYRNPDSEKQSEANRWLIDLQKSVYAWKVADELLQRQADINSCYLGAQMIRSKIMLSFHELPQDAVLSLHKSLMQHLKKRTKETESIIRLQLCISVVDLTLQMDTWNNPIYSFLNQCNEIPHLILLEILKVFPEEVDTKAIRLGSNRRNEIENELNNCAGLLNDYLKHTTAVDPSRETLLKAIQCFTSWVNVIRNISEIVKCDLIPEVFKILTNPSDTIYETSSTIESKLHDAATELLCNVLRALRTPDADCVLDFKLYTEIAAFEPAYHTSVARENIEKAINYCQIFSELGEAFMVKMVNESKPGCPHFSLRVLDLVLMCAGHHDYEVSSFTFCFWFSLAEFLYHKDDDHLIIEFKPYINRLLTALCRQVQMEPDCEGLIDDSDDFKLFRDKVCDLVRDSVFIVGSTNTFCQIFMTMQNTSPLSWDQIEANLFIMYAVAWKISPEENTVVPLTVESIVNLPKDTHVAVKHTAILILGELRDWFDRHPNYLISALQYLEINLRIKELGDAAASSLCHICCSAKMKLREEFAPLLDILKNLQALGVNNRAAINIIKGSVTVMCQLSTENIAEALKKICSYQTKPLLEILHQRIANGGTVEKANSDASIVLLDRIAAIFRFLEQPSSNDITVPIDVRAACVPAFAEVQPVLFQAMDVYQKDVLIMERCCRCLRFAIRILGKSGVFMLESLIQKLVELYRANGHSCFLYVGSILVDEFGDDSSNWELLLQMVDAFIGPTFALLQNPNGFRVHPDTIDDLFRLCTRILERLPIAFLRSGGVWPLIECGLVAISTDHREANASVMKFFHEMFDCTSSDDQTKNIIKREAVRHIFEKHGEALVQNLMHASVFVLPSYTLVNTAEVLHDLMQFDAQFTLKWIELAVQQLPNQSSSGSLMASPEQIRAFLNSCEQATKMRDVSRALRDFTLYYR